MAKILLDGSTRDRKATMNKLDTVYVPMIGSTVKVCITCIVSVEEFYVHIPEMSARSSCGSLEELKRKINAINMVNKYQPFVGMPGV